MHASARYAALLAAALALAAAPSPPPDAHALTVDYFLKIDGINGESTDRDHRDWIDIYSVSWSTGRTPPSGGPGALIVRKRVDKASPTLAQACTNNEHYPEVLLSMRDRGRDGPAATRRVVLEGVRLSRCQPAARNRPIESMTLNFAEIKVE